MVTWPWSKTTRRRYFLPARSFDDLSIRLIIAGSDPSNMLVDAVKKNRNVELRINPGEGRDDAADQECAHKCSSHLSEYRNQAETAQCAF
jgi:hypothetical protein